MRKDEASPGGVRAVNRALDPQRSRLDPAIAQRVKSWNPGIAIAVPYFDALAEEARTTDRVGRWGAEEFVVALTAAQAWWAHCAVLFAIRPPCVRARSASMRYCDA